MTDIAKKLRELADAIDEANGFPKYRPHGVPRPPEPFSGDEMCGACRLGGVCNCWRPERGPFIF